MTDKEQLEEVQGIYVAMRFLEEEVEAKELDDVALETVLQKANTKLSRELGKDNRPELDYESAKAPDGSPYDVAQYVYKSVEGQSRRLRNLEIRLLEAGASVSEKVSAIVSGFDLILNKLLDKVGEIVDETKSEVTDIFPIDDESAEQLNESIEGFEPITEEDMNGDTKENTTLLEKGVDVVKDAGEKLMDSIDHIIHPNKDEPKDEPKESKDDNKKADIKKKK